MAPKQKGQTRVRGPYAILRQASHATAQPALRSSHDTSRPAEPAGGDLSLGSSGIFDMGDIDGPATYQAIRRGRDLWSSWGIGANPHTGVAESCCHLGVPDTPRPAGAGGASVVTETPQRGSSCSPRAPPRSSTPTCLQESSTCGNWGSTTGNFSNGNLASNDDCQSSVCVSQESASWADGVPSVGFTRREK